MPIYDFQRDFSTQQKTGFPDPGIEKIPLVPQYPVSIKQSSDTQSGRVDVLGDSVGKHPDYVEEFIIPGFRALDAAMKNYWSGIKVPTKDSYRYMRTKIAGGDKSLMTWKDMLADGRAILPVCSINRTGHQFNSEKFSPPYLSMTRRHTSSRRDRAARIRRPVPYNVDYELIVWAEHKTDAEYALYQISTRFHPLAQFKMNDEHIYGWITLKDKGFTDASDKETGHDQKSKIRYEFRMTAEAWLPLPEFVVPTVLGHINVVKETAGDVLMTINGNKIIV